MPDKECVTFILRYLDAVRLSLKGKSEYWRPQVAVF